ncbi:SufE family protein [Shewanella avicenniae]|uniref:SufE family protein n=1 Tax=Shewanella avicenniae TaxID=2814294 RepID=A0ABX7QS67_9GAMM|nr:SufE family protein [Shewanella avicenniae]QSX34292.1 SufE family protein [Shewanella avicenniae]
MTDALPSLPATQFSAFYQQQDKLLSARDKLAQASNWQDKYRLLMQLGKLLPAMDDAFKTAKAQVDGCESAAWLYHTEINGQHFYLADSEARIVKGLIVLILAATNGATTADINAFNAEAYFAQLGLAGQLSPSRSNGLYALVQQVKLMAQ